MDRRTKRKSDPGIIMFSNFTFTATWSFVIIQKVTNLLRCKLRSRPKDNPTSFGFFTTLKRAFSNQASFKFSNSSEYVELKSAVDGRGVDPLVHDNEINLLLLKSLNNYRKINYGTSKSIKLGENKNVFLSDKVESAFQLRSIFGRTG